VKVLFATSEALPFYKTGGLADVARALPDALVERGHDVRITMPGYSFLAHELTASSVDAELAIPWPGGALGARVACHVPSAGAVTAFMLTRTLFDTQQPYNAIPRDELGLGRRFAFFCRAVVAYARHWGADIVHLNDWQTGLVPLYALMDGMDAATLFSIHNLAYQGNFPPLLLADIGVPSSFLRTENGIEFHGQASFMKGAIALADRLATVSPTYAREIQTPAGGAGLEGLLSHRRRTLHGVLNGIDTQAWDPARDALLPVPYNARTLAQKAHSRSALIAAAGVSGAGPVLGIVSRLAHQKGIDILVDAMPRLVTLGCSVVVLGSGDSRHERDLGELAQQHPQRIASRHGFDEPFAHLIYAGADFFLMPSLYEPCGLGQMIAQRYGTPPIARRTGGLSDTIDDGATGFLFDDPGTAAFLETVTRAVAVWQGSGWRALQTRCMRQDHSWSRSAGEYERLYNLAMGALAP
jgi:starch synthase